MRRTNKTLRQGVCTAYIGHRRLPSLPEEQRHKVTSRSDLRSPGKISRLSEFPHSRWEFSQKRREGEKTRGKAVFPGTGLFLYFPGSLLYFELYIEINGKYKVTWGQQSWPLIETMLFFFIPSDIQSSQVIYIIFWPRGLLTFYDLFWWWLVNQKTYWRHQIKLHPYKAEVQWALIKKRIYLA